ncbi:hypothetical protein [Peribacillus alkalitolerans]|uniref:hypothetical protein n=1 Tax=Peribacillus alkalitolerans TaxID=1550385 RepID=UPI0019682A5B|nr:hypothetical protein [Peribacillus alkalitolerans]
MWMFIGVLSFIGIFVFLFMALFSRLKKSGKSKRMMLYAGGCFVLLIAALSFDDTVATETASSSPKEETKSDEVKKKDEEAKLKEANQKAEEDKKKAKDLALAKAKADEEAKKKAEEEAKKKAEQETPQYKLNKAVTKVLGKESNREGKKITALSIDQKGNIILNFKADDNLTEGLIVGGVKMDITDVLEAIKNTKLTVNSINVIATFEMVDQYGNGEESEVVNVTYSNETLGKINFDNFSYNNVYTIADTITFINPQFVGK